MTITIIDDIQSKLVEHSATHGDLPDFIVVNDNEYAELVSLTFFEKHIQKVNDRCFWGVPIVVCSTLDSFTFCYTKQENTNPKGFKWLVGETQEGLFVKLGDYEKNLQNTTTFMTVNGEKLQVETKEVVAPILTRLIQEEFKTNKNKSNNPPKPPIQ